MGNVPVSNLPALLNDSSPIIGQLENICRVKANVPKTITMRSRGQKIIVSSQNPHMVLVILKYFQQLANIQHFKTHPTGSARSLIYAVEITNGKLQCRDWTILLIDFINEQFPHYKYAGNSTWAGDTKINFEERIYFIPQNTQKINLPSQGVMEMKQNIQYQPVIQQVQVQSNNNNNNQNDDNLPKGWEKAVTSDGRVYYKNNINKTTQWNRPKEDATEDATKDTLQ